MPWFNFESEASPFFFVSAGILFFYVLEKCIPFRLPTLSKFHRWFTNISLNIWNIMLVDLCFMNLLKRTAIFSDAHRLNLYEKLHLNSFWRIALTIILLDFAMYVWHRFNHVIPFLWRFHRVHHTDLNVDVSSALRFHFGEVTVSTIIVYSLMLFLGATIVEVRIFQVCLFLMAQFGHSNIKLWRPLERALWWVLVPPSMHRIHHSSLRPETNSNYGTIFSVWDRCLGTLCRDTIQEKIVFGLNEFKDPRELTLLKLLMLPFRNNKKEIN